MSPAAGDAMSKRQLVYVPEINDKSFVLLNWRGDAPRSYTLRDFMVEGDPTVTSGEFHRRSASEILDSARWRYPAPRHSVEDGRYWRKRIKTLNSSHGLSEDGRPWYLNPQVLTPIGAVIAAIGGILKVFFG